MKSKFSIFLIIIVVFILVNGTSNVFASPTILKKTHDYVTAFDLFMRTSYKHEISRTKTALISDLDGDGENEMVTFYVSNNKNYGSFQNIAYHFTVYDMVNGKCISTSLETTPGYNIEGSNKEDIYLTKNGYIVHVVYDLGDVYYINSYKNGELFEEIDFTDQTDSGNGYSYFKDGELHMITKQEYIKLYDKYQIGKNIKNFMTKNGNNISNDIKEIQKLSSYSKVEDIEVVLKGKELQFNLPIINFNNHTFYPFRELSEKLGAEVSWDSTSEMATCTKGDNVVSFKVNSSSYWLNGNEIEMEPGTSVFIENDKTYIPIRYISESLGYGVEWNDITRTISIK